MVRCAIRPVAAAILQRADFEQPVANCGNILGIDCWLRAQDRHCFDAFWMERGQEQADDRAIAKAHNRYLLKFQLVEQCDQIRYILAIIPGSVALARRRKTIAMQVRSQYAYSWRNVAQLSSEIAGGCASKTVNQQ